MPSRIVRVRRAPEDGVAAHELRDGIVAIQTEMGVSAKFPPEVEQAAAEAAHSPRLPEVDRTDLPLVTIDPADARDLDQAVHIERVGSGYRVYYAIADVAAFVSPGDPIDIEANRRGETLYGADSKIPLHPPVISEDAGSLLPDQVRPALLWVIDVDETGEGTSVEVERALVRSRAKLDYESVQRSIDEGTAEEVFTLLQEVGTLRQAREAVRGGVSLPLPTQEIYINREHWHLAFRSLHPVEEWNAQISLLTGMGAASLMVQAGVGILRTLPPADPRDIERLHRVARALEIAWPAALTYPDFIRSLEPSLSNHAAMVVACTRLLRGAGYAAFNGSVPDQPLHAGLASEYTHVTAPLRRLVDRYTSEVCVSLCAGEKVPDWVLERFDSLPGTMQESGQRAGQYERAIIGLVEAAVLAPRVGETFAGVVVELDEKAPHRGDVTIQRPAIEAKVTATNPLPLGEEVTVTLAAADIASRSVTFTLP